MLSLCLNVNSCCARIATLLQLHRERLYDVGEDPLALYLFKYLVFVDSRQSRVLSDSKAELVEELGFLEVLRDGSLDRIELLI